MTSVSSFERGWNGVSRTREPGLNVYVAADGTQTAYFKGRIDGRPTTIPLDGANLTEWKRACRAVRGNPELAKKKSGDRSVKVEDFIDVHIAAERNKVGHQNSRLRRSKRSVEHDEQRLNRFLRGSKLGRKKFGDVKTDDVRVFVTEEIYALRKDDGTPYAENTLRDVARCLSALFRTAKLKEMISFNPVRELEADEKPTSEPRHKKRYLDPAQVDAFLAEVSPVFRPVMYLCAWSGLRISEALGLVWGNFDLEAGTMTVELQLGDDDRVDVKTRASQATVPLLPDVLQALRAHRREMGLRGIHLVKPDALVFVTESGEPQCRRNALRAVYAAGDRLGLNGTAEEPLKKVDIHSLRHSFITNGIDAGLAVTTVSLLSRNSVETIVRYYAGQTESKRADAAVEYAAKVGR